jgi:hypothetical protein
MKLYYQKPYIESVREIENYGACQYFTEFVSPSYEGTYETFTGNCPNPSGSQPIIVTFEPDPNDPQKGFVFLPNQITFPVTILDSEGHFSGSYDISNPSPFGDECISQPQHIELLGQVTLEAITFEIEHTFFNMTDNPNDPDPCQLLGQDCMVPSEFNGTAV